MKKYVFYFSTDFVILNFGSIEAFTQRECLKVANINFDLFIPWALESHLLASHLQGAGCPQKLQQFGVRPASQLGELEPHLLGFQLYGLYAERRWKTAPSWKL